MDFFQHQDEARRQTGRLVLLFAGAVVAIVIAVYLVVIGVFVLVDDTQRARPDVVSVVDLWQPSYLLATALGVGTVILAGSLYRTATLATGGKSVADLLGGRLLASSTHDWRERRLLNVVEEMALASGSPVPPVYILESESDVNAFAAGFAPADAVIGITRGAVNNLTRDELQGVIAHEFSHILNGDMRLNIRLIGVLHGILLLSMIGYVVMRMLMNANTSSRSGSRSSSNDKKDGGGGILLAIFLIGLGLYIIGYVGVFFGHLIKSAVSRQREYLADASAVQFTRLPSGIADALKKLGAIGSRIKSPQAEQASHMYFGNGMKASFLQMLATHPPLVDRIRRLEPNFDGDFSKEHLKWPSPEEETESGAKSAEAGLGRLRKLGMLGAAAGFGDSSAASPAMEISAADVVEQVGAPERKHLNFAVDLISQLPEDLAETLHKPPGAAAVIYALLLEADPSDDEPGLRMLGKALGPETADKVRALIPRLTSFGSVARLPLAQLSMTALRQLSPNEFDEFRQNVVALIRADRKVSVFEYCLQRIIFKNLAAFFRPRAPVRVRHSDVASVASSATTLLSALAYAGSSGDAELDSRAAAESFGSGAALLGLGARGPVAHEAAGFGAIDEALEELAASTGELKRKLLAACAATIGHDGRLTLDEAELLRVVADALECPIPPAAAEFLSRAE